MHQHSLRHFLIRVWTVSCLLTCSMSWIVRTARAAGPVISGVASASIEIRRVVDAAKGHAPEVARARAALRSSRSARENGRLAPFGNPYLEVTVQGSNKGVVKDVAVSGALWLPFEAFGQRGSRRREAEGFVALHGTFVEQARAEAAARAVLAYGRAAVAKKRGEVLRELFTSARTQATMLNERMASGDATQRDVSLASAEAARHEVMLTENAAALLRAESELAELTGHEDATVLATSTPPSLAGRELRQEQVRDLPQSRALAAEARYHDAAADRWEREGRGLLSVGLVAGRGDYGEARLGGGLAYAIPAFRANRPEKVREEAESARARDDRGLYELVAERRLHALSRQQAELDRARSVLSNSALPAAQMAADAVQETYEAGKTELLSVLLTRRELSALLLRRLELSEASWQLASEYVAITGDLP
jgi:outer membrane protein TolC